MAIPRNRGHRIAIALLGGAVLSVFKLALHCRNVLADACVMEKRYYYALLPIEAVIFGAAVFVILTLMKAPPE